MSNLLPVIVVFAVIGGVFSVVSCVVVIGIDKKLERLIAALKDKK